MRVSLQQKGNQAQIRTARQVKIKIALPNNNNDNNDKNCDTRGGKDLCVFYLMFVIV